MNTVNDVKYTFLPKIIDPRGTLSFIEGNIHIPFKIERVYYLYDLHKDSERGSHAHRCLEQLFIALNGTFTIEIRDGLDEKTFELNDPSQALYLPSGLWRNLVEFSSGSVCLVLASERFDEGDYIRDYSDFEVFRGIK